LIQQLSYKLQWNCHVHALVYIKICHQSHLRGVR